jgi:16S rRNA (guanine527-N7)-methyltransferase
MGIELIEKYFPGVSPLQKEKLIIFSREISAWNKKINLISRKDDDNLWERHILHSLSLHFVLPSEKKIKILDAGTGGGLPGIPLAIFRADQQFHLVDSIGKKITALEEIVRQVDLTNVTCEQQRIEKLKGSYDFIVSRAVAPLEEIYRWTRHLTDVTEKQSHWFILKGGDLKNEISALNKPCEEILISSLYKESFFAEKRIVIF